MCGKDGLLKAQGPRLAKDGPFILFIIPILCLHNNQFSKSVLDIFLCFGGEWISIMDLCAKFGMERFT